MSTTPTSDTAPTTGRLDLLALQQIRDAGPCADGWAMLLKGLGESGGKPDLSRVVSLGDIAHTNNAQDALWATRCLPHTIEVRRYRVSLLLPLLRRSLTNTTDQRVHDVVESLAAWVAGDDSVDLEAAAWAAEAAWAAWAAEAAWAAWAAEAAWAARAAEAAWAARAAEAAWAAGAAEAAECDQQRLDIIGLSPLYALVVVMEARMGE